MTLVVPAADPAAVKRVLERHGRVAQPIANPSVARRLLPGEAQFLTTPGHCDCGTVLAPRVGPDFEATLEQEGARLARKGWSKSKVARALDDRRRAAARPDGGGGDSAELWANVLGDLHRELKLPYAGLLVRLYEGRVADEAFEVDRVEARIPGTLVESVAPLSEDTLTIFRSGGAT
ncbi:hypothetical protein [Phenylobacterium sp.]|uniref:hypothetical protein n=1 Tax=Phenylobacterium sp. TaxID=1871053 RepID=UPI002ED7988F